MKIRRAISTVLLVALTVLVVASGAMGGNPHGTPPGQAKKQDSSQSGAGVKPSNDTGKNTECTSGGGQGSSATCSADNSSTSSKPDASKRYGNGTTAAQVANGRGAPSGSLITGPGNSQPHKICGRDVHAYGKGKSHKCGSSTSGSTAAGSTASGSTAGSSTPSGSTASGSTAGSNAASGVLGASATLPAASSSPTATSGVLGTSAALRSSTASGTLPFTGLPLWIPALVALAMIGTGLGLARRHGTGGMGI
ncbi:MAG: hypothetical protein ACRDNM_13315 [Gaiellaceae bacterium]